MLNKTGVRKKAVICR